MGACFHYYNMVTPPRSPMAKAKALIPKKRRSTTSIPDNCKVTKKKSLPTFLESRVYAVSNNMENASPRDSSVLTQGFLSSDDIKVLAVTKQQSAEKFCEKPILLDYINLLSMSFPDFPKRMIESLVARFDGNCDAVYNFLLGRDLKPISADLAFEDKVDEHFTCPYYFGQAPSRKEIIQILRPYGSGHFITYYRTCEDANQFKYYVCYKNRASEISEKAIRLPFIPDVLKTALGLTEGIRCPNTRDRYFVPLLK